MGNVVGIDLGTTNSVAAFRFAAVTIVSAEDNSPPDRFLTPSIVAWQNEQLVVGQAARNQLQGDPQNVVSNIKRLMGRGFSDSAVQTQMTQCTYRINSALHGTENSLVVQLGDKEYAPEEISAAILQKVLANANRFQQQQGQTATITEAVITVPAYFNDRQRHATQLAATKAGITARELLAEPTAAAISYGFQPDSTEVQTILVYDFGGGTFDASLITASGNWFTELGKAGDLWLGGENLDRQAIDLVLDEVATTMDMPEVRELIAAMAPDQQRRFWTDLKAAVEQAKIALSSQSAVRVIPATPFLDEMGLPLYIDVELTVDRFNRLIQPLIDRTIQLCQSAIACADCTAEMIDRVLLVGGSSQIPIVQQRIREEFGADRVLVHPRPMYAIAEGAAIVAAGLTEKVCTVSRDYYIKLVTGMEKVIAQGDTLPHSGMQTFRTVAADQQLIHFEFFNRDEGHQVNEPVGDMWLSLVQSYPAGTEIAVVLELDEQNSSLQISAFLKQDPSVRVSSSFSRGQADEKIYQQIAEIIRDSNQQNLSLAESRQINQRIAPIIATANQIIDPRTGNERSDLFQKAEADLHKLKQHSDPDRRDAEMWASYFDYVVYQRAFLIPPTQVERLKKISHQLRDALRREDLAAIQAGNEEARAEDRLLPEWIQRLHYINVAVYKSQHLKPAQSRVLDNKLDRLVEALKQRNEAEAEKIWYELQIDANEWIETELPIGTIDTGLRR
jgi:molecular chaperone DnaK